MVYALHKFKHFLLGNKFIFYVDHMALVYLVNKPHVSRRIAKWLLLFLEYEFTIIYKPSRTHVVVDVLSKLLNRFKTIGSPKLDCGCIIIFCKTYMDVGNKNLFKDMLDTRNSELSPKTEVGQKGRTL